MYKTVQKVTVLSIATVALVAFIISYVHMSELMLRQGEQWRSWLYPLAVDGMMIQSSMVMLIRRKTRKPIGWLPRTCFGGGLLASLLANVAVVQSTLPAQIFAALCPVILAGAFEMFLEQIKPTPSRRPARRKAAPIRKIKAA